MNSESLHKANGELHLALDYLRETNAGAGAVESVLLLQIIKLVAQASNAVHMLIDASAADDQKVTP